MSGRGLPRAGIQGSVDVVICGGGLAGLTLARQLRLQQAERTVVVLDRLKHPFPEGAFKVGEGTVEVGANYLGGVLGLEGYLQRRHLLKYGLRFFFRNGQPLPFEDRPEFGLSGDPPLSTYLIDRGRLENDLREMLIVSGIDLREGFKVEEIHLGHAETPHEVVFSGPDGDRGVLRCRWLVDATGRRKLLLRTLGLEEPRAARCSAAWFRVSGSLTVRDLVSSEIEQWHQRVPPTHRDWTVAHLVGRGYWLWIIPLASRNTSLGIVVDRSYHDFQSFSTLERAFKWLADHEPEVGRELAGREFLDFKVMDQYSYSSRQVFSSRRWACIGEAALFSDPLNSPGLDLISFGNCMVADMIRQDFRGTLDDWTVHRYDRYLRALNDLLTYQFQLEYAVFGNPVAAVCKILWNVASAWSIYTPQFLDQTFIDQEKGEAFRRATMGYFFLARRVHLLFQQWGRHEPSRARFELIDYGGLPFLLDLAWRNLHGGKTSEEIARDQRRNMEVLEELAQALFLVAIEDRMPESLARLQEPVWINAWKMGLDPSRWERDGLFEPMTTPRNLSPMREQIRALFRFEEGAA